MAERVDARDVMDANAWTSKAFRATILGHFRRLGPNAWDDYEFIPSDPEPIDVFPGVRIQMERGGAEFRMRRKGKVLRLRWLPQQEDLERLGTRTSNVQRTHFLANYVEGLAEAPGIGPAAYIAKKLS